jgi:uncharacterized cysteine cluster protein YcgN (CxxCxxCC family)
VAKNTDREFNLTFLPVGLYSKIKFQNKNDKKMVNGNDIIEHIEKCDNCMTIQKQIDNLKDEIKIKELFCQYLNRKIENCFVNKNIIDKD